MKVVSLGATWGRGKGQNLQVFGEGWVCATALVNLSLLGVGQERGWVNPSLLLALLATIHPFERSTLVLVTFSHRRRAKIDYGKHDYV